MKKKHLKLLRGSNIENFWRFFQEIEENLRRAINAIQLMPQTERQKQEYSVYQLMYQGLGTDIESGLKKVRKGITFSFSLFADNDNKLEFVLSGEGNKKLFPVIRDIVEQAPDMKYFKPVFLRPRLPKGYEPGEISFGRESVCRINLSQCYFSHEFNVVTRKIDLSIALPEVVDLTSPYLDKTIRLGLDSILGEYDAAMRIGKIDTAHMPSSETFSGLGINRLIDLCEIVDKYFVKEVIQ